MEVDIIGCELLINSIREVFIVSSWLPNIQYSYFYHYESLINMNMTGPSFHTLLFTSFCGKTSLHLVCQGLQKANANGILLTLDEYFVRVYVEMRR